jgi:transaldolase
MTDNPLAKLEGLGQSIWLDDLGRGLFNSGELRRLVAEGLSGVTSNPAIFEKSIAESEHYDEDIRALAAKGLDASAIYESLSQHDVRSAADELRPLYERTDGLDGYVSLEVNPHLANDTQRTIDEARRLWSALDRPNVLVKVPATAAGLPAIRRLVGDGINVNVTLLFGLPRYGEVAEAYIAGLEARAAGHQSLKFSASVASFFVSRIDVVADAVLTNSGAPGAGELRGIVAVASAKMAYQAYKEAFQGERFAALALLGARPQRLLWASTGSKLPGDSDVKYVEALIGKDTVTTLPLRTLDAYREHGQPQARLELGLDEAQRAMQRLSELGININQLTQQLADEGVVKFDLAFDALLAAIAAKSRRPA